MLGGQRRWPIKVQELTFMRCQVSDCTAAVAARLWSSGPASDSSREAPVSSIRSSNGMLYFTATGYKRAPAAATLFYPLKRRRGRGDCNNY